MRKLTLALPAALALAALYYADEVVFAAPVVGLTAWLGAWQTFALLGPTYFALAYGSLRFAADGTIQLELQHRVLRSRPQDSVILGS